MSTLVHPTTGQRAMAGWWVTPFCLLLIFALSALLLVGAFLLPIVPLDEGINLVYPELILKGYVPNLDFCSLYPPGNFWLLAIAFKLFGANLVTERAVGFLYVIVIAFGVFFLARRRGAALAVALAVSVSLVMQAFPNAMAAFSWFGGAGVIVWSLVVARNWLESPERVGLLALSGLLAGSALLLRHDLAPAVALVGLGITGLRPRDILIYGAGVVTAAIPMFVHLWMATPGAVIDNMVWDVLRAGPTRRLPLDYSQPMLWLTVLSCVAPAVVALLRFRSLRRGPGRIVFGLAALCLAVLPQALGRADLWHLAYVSCFTIPLAILAVIEGLGRRLPSGAWLGPARNPTARRVGRAAMIGGAVIAVILLSIFGPAFARQTYAPVWWNLARLGIIGGGGCTTCVRNEGRVLPVPQFRVQLQAVIDDLEARSKPGERLFVGPRDLSRTNYNDSFLYYLFPKLRPGNYYIEMASQVANRPGTRMSADLARSDYALLDAAYDDWNEDNASRIPGSTEPLAVLDREFCLLAEHKPYQLYGKCSPATAKPAS